jgi:hypothetical protein
MDPVFGTMLDVVRIVTFQPVAPRATPRVARWTEEAVAEEPGPTPIVKHEPKRLWQWLSLSMIPR